MRHLDRITMDPTRMGGKPCIRDTRVTVGTVVGLVAEGHTPEEIVEAYPYLDTDDSRPHFGTPPGAQRKQRYP
jgi:uncharacterized protein (DUF433 family)